MVFLKQPRLASCLVDIEPARIVVNHDVLVGLTVELGYVPSNHSGLLSSQAVIPKRYDVKTEGG